MSANTSRIHILPTHLANQIAAGEVIERPASVVKELLENSLDAKANQIKIEIVDGGLSKIRVQDNGLGVHPEDMLLTLSAHATSKISAAEDLAQIMTLGFRGEALASISSVSELSLTSAQKDNPHAWQVKAKGRDIAPHMQAAAHPVGTSVEVQHLFYNTPARRKFLRSSSTEWLYTEEVIRRILLSRFDVDFSVQHHHKKIDRYPITDKEDRIAKVLSPAFIEVAHRIDAKTTQLHLTGFVAPGDFSRSSHDWQYFYLNGRMVKDKLIQHALRQAYADQLYPGRYAAYVLYLSLDPAFVDVNVHPTKHEVRFQNARLVHDFIAKSVIEALQEEAPGQLRHCELSCAIQVPHSTLASEPGLLRRSARNDGKTGELVTVINNQLIITQIENGLGVIDLHAYFAYQAHHVLQQQPITREPLLNPQSFKISAKQQDWIIQNQAWLKNLGFVIDQIGEHHCLMREIPAILSHADISELWEVLLKMESPEDIALLSCKAVPKSGMILSSAQTLHILDTVEALPLNACCPHGLKIWQTLSLDELRGG